MHLQETGHVDITWNAANQEGQEYVWQQTGWAHLQSFKRDLLWEGYIFLSDIEEPRSTVTLGSSRGKHQICPRGLWGGSSKKVMWMIAQLKCLYTNAFSMGNRQEIDTMMQLENYYLIAITLS